jgi:hypothetical protein
MARNTLVTVGSLHGILTAAHVTETLPKDGNVGLILCFEDREHYQRLIINMGHTETASRDAGATIWFARSRSRVSAAD